MRKEYTIVYSDDTEEWYVFEGTNENYIFVAETALEAASWLVAYLKRRKKNLDF